MLLLLSVMFSCYTTDSTAQIDSTNTDTTNQYFPIPDSLGYMDEIAANKQKYINQRLSVLLKDLKIPIQSFYIHHDRLRCFGIYIYFDNSFDSREVKWNNQKENPINILIEWEKPILRSGIEDALHKGAGEWTTAELKYFEDEIVSDIILPFRKQN